MSETLEAAQAGAAEDYDEVLASNFSVLGDLPKEVVASRRRTVGQPPAEHPYLKTRLLLLALVVLLILTLGLTIIVVWLWRGGKWPLLGTGQPEAPWSMTECYSVLVRSAALAVGVLVVVALLVPLLNLWGSLLASLGMIWLARRHLLRPRGLTFRDAFGLGVPREVGTLALVSLAALALATLGGGVINWAAELVGWGSHWTEYYIEELLIGPPGTVLLLSIDAVVWAPLFEEIGFRGLVYASLRRRLKVAPAILLSATLFSVIHFYTVSGFLSLLWGGILMALLYEKTRSLWPCIILHALWNLLALSSLLLFYR